MSEGIYKKNGKNFSEVRRVVDTGDGYIRIENNNGSIEFVHKSEIEKITFPVEDRPRWTNFLFRINNEYSLKLHQLKIWSLYKIIYVLYEDNNREQCWTR